MRDMKNNIATARTISPAAITATASGSSVDLQGYESATFLVMAGAWTDGSHVLSAEESDDGSSWSAVAAADLIGTFPTFEDDSSPAGESMSAGASYRVGYIGNSRYIRAKTTVSGGPSTGAVYGVDVILGNPHTRPTT